MRRTQNRRDRDAHARSGNPNLAERTTVTASSHEGLRCSRCTHGLRRLPFGHGRNMQSAEANADAVKQCDLRHALAQITPFT